MNHLLSNCYRYYQRTLTSTVSFKSFIFSWMFSVFYKKLNDHWVTICGFLQLQENIGYDITFSGFSQRSMHKHYSHTQGKACVLWGKQISQFSIFLCRLSYVTVAFSLFIKLYQHVILIHNVYKLLLMLLLSERLVKSKWNFKLSWLAQY